jgi:hypothetical protein
MPGCAFLNLFLALLNASRIRRAPGKLMGKSSRRKRERQMGLPLTLPPWMQGDVQIRRNHDGPKISALLGKLIDPYVIKDITPGQFRKLVACGVIAWNLSSFEESRRTEEIGRFIDDIGAADFMDFTAIIQIMVARKLALFPDDSRFVVSWDVKQDNNRFHITAAALVANPNPKEQKIPDPRGAMSA